MLFQNWMPIDFTQAIPTALTEARVDYCIRFDNGTTDVSALLQFAQGLPPEKKMAVYFPSTLIDKENYEQHIDTLMAIFFQPAYYVWQNRPVIFMEADALDGNSDFFKQLKRHCVLHQYTDLQQLYTVKRNGPGGWQSFSPGTVFYHYWDNGKLPLSTYVTAWISVFNPGNAVLMPIHFVIDTSDNARQLDEMNNLLAAEKDLGDQEDKQYRLAEKLYLQQMELLQLRDQISKHTTNEDNLQRYLDIQRKDLARALDWYHYEYEILPLWFKRVGQVIKVIMGKRTFKSLFNDNVKKYTD